MHTSSIQQRGRGRSKESRGRAKGKESRVRGKSLPSILDTMLLLFDSPVPSFSPSPPQIDFNEKEDDKGDKEEE